MSITLASSLIGLGLYLGSLLWLGTRSRNQEHADAIARSCETEKEEGTEIGRDQREKQHTGLKPTIR